MWSRRKSLACRELQPTTKQDEKFMTVNDIDDEDFSDAKEGFGPLPAFFLDWENFKDAYVWNICLIRNVPKDYNRVHHKYKVILNPDAYPGHCSDVQYALWLITHYEKVSHPSEKYEDIPENHFLGDLNHRAQPVKAIFPEYVFSIPLKYYGPLTFMNRHIHHLFYHLFFQSKEHPPKRTYTMFHTLSYLIALCELFNYEVITAHRKEEMSATWNSKALIDWCHRLAAYKHLEDPGNNTGNNSNYRHWLYVHNAKERGIFNNSQTMDDEEGFQDLYSYYNRIDSRG
jgi:hypothetical protein